MLETFIHKLLLLFDKVLQKWKLIFTIIKEWTYDVIVDKRCSLLVYFLSHVLGNLGVFMLSLIRKKGRIPFHFSVVKKIYNKITG